jgi:hypothetical protein
MAEKIDYDALIKALEEGDAIAPSEQLAFIKRVAAQARAGAMCEDALRKYMHAMEGFAEAIRWMTATAYPWPAQEIERDAAKTALAAWAEATGEK